MSEKVIKRLKKDLGFDIQLGEKRTFLRLTYKSNVSFVSKPELARLIGELQELHDKMQE